MWWRIRKRLSINMKIYFISTGIFLKIYNSLRNKLCLSLRRFNTLLKLFSFSYINSVNLSPNQTRSVNLYKDTRMMSHNLINYKRPEKQKKKKMTKYFESTKNDSLKLS